MRGFVVYTTNRCGWCTRAKKLLTDNGITYTEVEVTSENSMELVKLVLDARGIKMSELHLTVPQIFFDGVLIGGHDDLVEWIKGYEGTTLPDMMPIVPPYLPLKDRDE